MSCSSVLSLDHIISQDVLDVRGDGKAGGGLVLAMQSFAALCIRDTTLHVQEWPFFSSARKGAAVRSFLRVSKKPITLACEVTRPHLAILMDDGAAKFVDFAHGVHVGGTFILNTDRTPEIVAKHYKLSGRVITIAGDKLGEKYLGAPRGNISVYAAMIKAVPSLNASDGKDVLRHILEKRRIPQALLEANLTVYEASLDACHIGTFECASAQDHQPQRFEGYGDLPIGAQTGLRISLGNITAHYARTGYRVAFVDPEKRCTGCTYCVINCPENIIEFHPDRERGILVTGADFNTYCKNCSECISVCPEKLFIEKPFQEQWE